MATSAETLVASKAELSAFLSSIPPSSTLFFDFRGYKYDDYEKISLITILVHPQGQIRLIDVHTLGDSTFTTESRDGKTLQSILEDYRIHTVHWDLKIDALALWSLYGVGITGGIDFQLLESTSFVDDFFESIKLRDPCRDRETRRAQLERVRWILPVKRGRQLERSGRYDDRPMDGRTVQACVDFITELRRVYGALKEGMSADWLGQVETESASEVLQARTPGCDPRRSIRWYWVAEKQKFELGSRDP